jgi:hypothetical protein
MDEGKARLTAYDTTRAIEAFQKAHDLMHVPTTGIALARAHLAAGHLVEARDIALEVGRLPHDPGDPAVFDAARKHAKELDAQLRSRIPTVRIKIKGGAASRVAVDDVEIPSAIVGEPVAMNPGKRVITARSADGGEARAEVELAERDVKEIELTLAAHKEKDPKPVVAEAAPASPTPSAPVPQLTGFGNDDVDRRPMGGRTPLAEVLIYGGFGLGAVGLVVGSITGGMTLSKASDIDPQCANDICAPAARSDLDSANTLGTVSTISFIAGGIGAAAGVVGLLLPRKPASPRRAGSVAPWITIAPSTSGLGGTF